MMLSCAVTDLKVLTGSAQVRRLTVQPKDHRKQQVRIVIELHVVFVYVIFNVFFLIKCTELMADRRLHQRRPVSVL